MCNVIFNQYNVFFQMFWCAWLELCKKNQGTVACARTFSSSFMKSPGQVGFMVFGWVFFCGEVSCRFDLALPSAPVSAVCPTGRAGRSQCLVGPGQRLPNVWAGDLLPPGGSCCPCFPCVLSRGRVKNIGQTAEGKNNRFFFILGWDFLDFRVDTVKIWVGALTIRNLIKMES